MMKNNCSVFFARENFQDGEIWKVGIENRNKFFLTSDQRLFIIEPAASEGSCLINNTLISSPRLYTVSPFDPLLLLLPKLSQDTRFRETSDILQESNLGFLVKVSIDFTKICEVKIHESNSHVRLNQDLLSTWLKSKITAVQRSLTETIPWIRTSSSSDLQSYKLSLALLAQFLPFSFIQNIENKFNLESLLNTGRPFVRRDELEENNASLKQKAGKDQKGNGKKGMKGAEVKKLPRGQMTLNFFKK
jgi:hypothetical protein